MPDGSAPGISPISPKLVLDPQGRWKKSEKFLPESDKKSRFKYY